MALGGLVGSTPRAARGTVRFSPYGPFYLAIALGVFAGTQGLSAWDLCREADFCDRGVFDTSYLIVTLWD